MEREDRDMKGERDGYRENLNVPENEYSDVYCWSPIVSVLGIPLLHISTLSGHRRGAIS
jgi:hypothetical protein